MLEGVDALFARKDIVEITHKALSKTILELTRVEVTAGAPAIELAAVPSCTEPTIEVGSTIRFESPTFSYELLLLFPVAAFLRLYSSTNRIEVTELESGMQDLGGELLNIAFGSIDPQLRALDLRLRSSFAHNLMGKNLSDVLKSRPKRAVLIPYTAADLPFQLQLFPDGALKRKWTYTPVKK